MVNIKNYSKLYSSQFVGDIVMDSLIYFYFSVTFMDMSEYMAFRLF
jgi:hypothetical protein